MSRIKVIRGVDSCAVSISKNLRAFMPKRPAQRNTQTANDRKAKARREKLRHHVYGEQAQVRRVKPNVRRRNNKMSSIMASFIERHQGMLTLASPFSVNNPGGVSFTKDALARFKRAYERKFPNAWAFTWHETSDKLMLHVHILFHTKSDMALAEIEQWAARTWSKNILSTMKANGCVKPLNAALKASLVKVTPYAIEQTGYFAKTAKRPDTLILLIAANGLRTFSLWGKANVGQAEARIVELTDDETVEVQREAMTHLYDEARRLGRPVNSYQEARILSGDFACFYMSHERLLALNARLGGKLLGYQVLSSSAEYVSLRAA